MAESVVQSGSFGTDSVLIVGAAEFGNTVELRWAFTVTANPNGFVARVVSVFDPDSGGAGFLISGTGVHNLILGQFPAGQYSFQIEPQGGIVAASSFTILERDPNEPDPGPGDPPPPFTVPVPVKVEKADEEGTSGYQDNR